MKIIDLLNKIAKGEEVPKKIKYLGESFIWNNELLDYCFEEDNLDFDGLFDKYMITKIIFDEVEVIEEEKEIEKLSFCDFAITINGNASNNDRILMDKINQLIDVINDMRDKE